MADFWAWAWRALFLGCIGIGLLFGLDVLGVLTAIGQIASGFLGMVFGVIALFGGFWWLDASSL